MQTAKWDKEKRPGQNLRLQPQVPRLMMLPAGGLGMPFESRRKPTYGMRTSASWT